MGLSWGSLQSRALVGQRKRPAEAGRATRTGGELTVRARSYIASRPVTGSPEAPSLPARDQGQPPKHAAHHRRGYGSGPEGPRRAHNSGRGLSPFSRLPAAFLATVRLNARPDRSVLRPSMTAVNGDRQGLGRETDQPSLRARCSRASTMASSAPIFGPHLARGSRSRSRATASPRCGPPARRRRSRRGPRAGAARRTNGAATSASRDSRGRAGSRRRRGRGAPTC